MVDCIVFCFVLFLALPHVDLSFQPGIEPMPPAVEVKSPNLSPGMPGNFPESTFSGAFKLHMKFLE